MELSIKEVQKICEKLVPINYYNDRKYDFEGVLKLVTR
jgi:hypothetical protein